MLHAFRRSSLVLLSVLLLGGGSAAGQTSNATLQGTISDPSGAVLPGVSVELQSPAFRGPGLFQVDLALQRRFTLGPSRNFEFRIEAFNAFNQQNLANPNTSISSGEAFGRITGPLNLSYGTGTARQMQFMVRLNY
jgi:hypothetical protein